MTQQERPHEAPRPQEPTSTSTNSVPLKGGKRRKSKESEEKAPVTLSVSLDFARKLRIVVSSLNESSGEYVESRLSAIVKRDLKKILEEMA